MKGPGLTDLLRWEAGACTPTLWVFADQSPGGETGIPAMVSLRDAVAHPLPLHPLMLPLPFTLGLSLLHSLQPRLRTMALAHPSSLPPGGRPSHPDCHVSDPAPPPSHAPPLGGAECVKAVDLGVKPGPAAS